MLSFREKLTAIIAEIFEKNGFERRFGEVTGSNRPDLCQYQCNGALAVAKQHKTNPMLIAQKIVDGLFNKPEFIEVNVVKPGFINLKVADSYLALHLNEMIGDSRFGVALNNNPERIIIDYGGPNVGKPLHVGHLRSAIIGDSLKRISCFLGNNVIGDVHLGDWGLQMGMIITELQSQHPEWVYFDENYKGEYPNESPITFADFEETYPKASRKAKEDEATMLLARRATNELQEGRPGYRALWKHFLSISVTDLKKSYDRLLVEFDLWKGESDVQEHIPIMVSRLIDKGYANESQGALIIEVKQETDDHEVPPFMLSKSDGSALYSTTDLATIALRQKEYSPNAIWYVVDQRQAMHFNQVFRCAYKTETVPKEVRLEHLGFGTMNGTDGKPFKTRDGGVMKLNDLIKIIEDKAMERLKEANADQKYEKEEREIISRLVGVAALKFADLSNARTKDYVFDIDRFSSFEGRTGTYIMYSVVRIKSILKKAMDAGFSPGNILEPVSETDRDLMLKITEFPNTVLKSFNDRMPNQLCDYAFELANGLNRFYHEHRILNEEDGIKRDGWLGLLRLTHDILEKVLDLLGIKVPERL